MSLKRMFRWGRPKKSRSPSRTDKSGPEDELQSTGISPSPEASTGVLSSVAQPFFLVTSSIPNNRKRKEKWPNLSAFSRMLNQSGLFDPLAQAIDDLCWFIGTHEDICANQEEYQTLRTQLEGLCVDLTDYFSGDTPPAMTTSMYSLCLTIQTELRGVYGTRDRDSISRYMQADQDLDRITGCYNRIRVQLERVMLNASLNMLRIADKQATEVQLRSLNPSISAYYDSAEANVVQRRECAPKTREKVLWDLKAWKDNNSGEKVCWMNGMAGTGKTTIATTLCSALDKCQELGASFFCTRSLPACRDVKLILPTIAYQLARFSSPFRGELLQVLDRDPDVHIKVPRVQFQRMVLEPLLRVMRSLPSRVVVVIDALDECDDGNGVEQILEVLLENSSELPIKFLVSSRPEYHIRERIRKSSLRSQLTLHELDDKMVKEDIETYLRTELASVPISLGRDELDALAERAGVLFIYAATVVRYIMDGDPVERLRIIMQSPDLGQESSNQTEEIDGLYEAVLVSAFNNRRLSRTEKERMEQVLHTIVCAQEPLTVDALSGLLGLKPSGITSALKPLWSVLHVSGPNTNDRVSTLHASFPEYILDPGRSGRFTCSPETQNGGLADLCFRRIERNVPQFNICDLGSSYVFDENIPDFDEKVQRNIPMDLLYACQYWAVHLSLHHRNGGRLTGDYKAW